MAFLWGCCRSVQPALDDDPVQFPLSELTNDQSCTYSTYSTDGADSPIMAEVAAMEMPTADGAKKEAASKDIRWAALLNVLQSLYGNDLDLLDADLLEYRKETWRLPTETAPSQELQRQKTPDYAQAPVEEETSLRDSWSGELVAEPTVYERKVSIHTMKTRRAALEESAPSMALQIDIVNPGELTKNYIKTMNLGEGSLGTVHLGKSILSKALRAIKTVPMSSLKGANQVLRKEIEVCKLVDHPNIVKLYEIFEDEQHTYLVMEACTGGTLAQHIKKDVGMDEDRAAMIMKQLFRAVRYLHESRVCHRDLRGETIMFSGNRKDERLTNRLRVTSFDVACTFKEGQVLKAVCGSFSHMAPEVFEKNYNYLADVWSVGVVMYEVCGGALPFGESSKQAMTKKALSGKVQWNKSWEKRSPLAIELVRGLMARDPKRRISLMDALHHEWIERQHPWESVTPLEAGIVQSLRGYRKLNQFKKAALSAIANHMDDELMCNARDAFLDIDRDFDGKLSVSELREFLEKFKREDLDEEQLAQACEDVFWQPRDKKEVARAVNTLRKRQSYQSDKAMPDFTYTEFLAATVDRTMISVDLCAAAFQSFDKDGDGSISVQELMFGRLLGKMGPEEREQLLLELDANGNGEIDFDEFVEMMRDERGWAPCFRLSQASLLSGGSEDATPKTPNVDFAKKNSSPNDVNKDEVKKDEVKKESGLK